jgi:hypothetical protein
MRSIILSSILMSLALLGACATGDQSSPAVVDRSEPVCLSDYDIRSFSPLYDEFMYVEGRRRDAHYLFTMQRGCLGLRSANTIGIPDRPGRICSNSLDDVVYHDISRGQTSCRILDIERVSSRDEARELAEARRKARREQ